MDFRNILIIRTDRVGDVILTTPMMAALRQNYPEARISVLVSVSTLELVEGNPHLNEILVDDRHGKHQGFWGFFRLVRGIRQKNFDAAFVMHTKNRTNSLCFLAGIPHRIGYKNKKFGFLLTEPIADTRWQGLKHEVDYCLDVLKELGILSRESNLYLSVSRSAKEWAQRFLEQNQVKESDRLVAIHPGASCISKRWNPERFAEVANELFEKKGFKVILVGSKDNKDIIQKVKESFHHPVIDAIGQTTLGQLAGLFERCQLLISNDSGPVHMASALGVPVISIFGRNQAGLSPIRWGPWGHSGLVLHKEVGCHQCLAHNCRINFRCLDEIKPKEVLEAVDALLAL